LSDYSLIGLLWLKGVLNKGRQLLTPIPLLPNDPQPCFASKKGSEIITTKSGFSHSLSSGLTLQIRKDVSGSQQ